MRTLIARFVVPAAAMLAGVACGGDFAASPHSPPTQYQVTNLASLGGTISRGNSINNRSWVAGYSNDVFAYIPSLRVLKEGGYEGGGAMIPYGQPGPFAESVEETIAAKVDDLMRQTGGQR